MLKTLQSLVINKIKTICKRLNSQSFLDIPELTAFFLELILIEDKRKYQDLLKSYFLLWNSIDYVYSLLIYGKLKKRSYFALLKQKLYRKKILMLKMTSFLKQKKIQKWKDVF